MIRPFKHASERRRYAALGLLTMLVLWLGLGLPWWAALAAPGLVLTLKLVLWPSRSSLAEARERRALAPAGPLTSAEAKILELLAERGDLSGLDLVHGSDGALTRYTVYARLWGLESRGYLTSRLETDPVIPGLRRRLYSLADGDGQGMDTAPPRSR
jgi:hypothetical protein